MSGLRRSTISSICRSNGGVTDRSGRCCSPDWTAGCSTPGVGTGRNIAYYPSGAEVFGIDLSQAMLRRAARRRRAAGAIVHLLPMDLVALDFADGFFDAAVASFVFCTMPPEARKTALRELARVVKPDGRVRLLEYAPARTPFRRAVARVWQPWVEWAFGAKLDQDIERELSAASLIVVSSRYVTSSIKLIEATPAQNLPWLKDWRTQQDSNL